MAPPHPFQILSVAETQVARDVILASHPDEVVDFREIFLKEPNKAELRPYLALEHAGRLSPTTPRPARLAKCMFDVIGSDKIPKYHESIVDIDRRKRIGHEAISQQHHASLTL